MELIKIYAVARLEAEKVSTFEGIKKVKHDDNGKYIEGSPKLAVQMADNKNWKCLQDLSKVKKLLSKMEQAKNDDEEEETELDPEDTTVDEDSDMGDDEWKEILTKLPGIKKYKELASIATETGLIEGEDFDKDTSLKDLRKMIRKQIKS